MGLSRFDPNLVVLGESIWEEILHAVDHFFDRIGEFLRTEAWFNTAAQIFLIDDLISIIANLPQAILLRFAEHTVVSPLGFGNHVIKLDDAFHLCVSEIMDSVQALDPQKNPRAVRSVLIAGQWEGLKQRIIGRYRRLGLTRLQKIVFAAIKILESPIKLFTFLFGLLRFVVNLTIAATAVAVLLSFFAGFQPQKWLDASLTQKWKRKKFKLLSGGKPAGTIRRREPGGSPP